jgi:hypothetical protein
MRNKPTFIAEDFRSILDRLALLEANEENVNPDSRPGKNNNDSGVQPSDLLDKSDSTQDDTDDAQDDTNANSNEDPDIAPDDEETPDEPEESPAADGSPDEEVDSLMTKPRNPNEIVGTIDVKSLASDLGLKNPKLFNAAFNSLRAGHLPNSVFQLRELAVAFDALCAADAETTTKVLNKLRKIHRA